MRNITNTWFFIRKHVFYLLLSFPLLGLSQSFVGQPIYTEAQRQEMKVRFANGPFKSRTTGSFGAYDGTFDKIISQKNAFIANPNAGDWDFAVPGNDELNKLPNQNTSNPTPQANGNIEDMHSAAIWAFTFYDDPNSAIAQEAISVAREVCKEIFDRSQDPLLDTSNRTRYNPGSFATNPHLFYVGKFTKYLNDYALLRSVNIDGLSSQERNAIDNWFKDADEFWGGKIDFDTKSRFGNNWKNEEYGSSSWNNAINDGSSRTNPIFCNSSGVYNTDYVVSEKMSGFWNIGYDYIMFRALYGIVYNVQTAKEHAWAYYRDTFKFAVFSDGTFAEMIRATSSKEDWGIFYGTVTFGAMVKLAVWHAMGVENGLVGMGDKGKYFDYSTSLGIDSYPSLNGHSGSDTSGGNKNLLLVAKAWAKFYEQAKGSTFGWQPQRYNDVSSGINLIEGANNFHYISPAAAMNAWYKDEDIKNWYKGLGNYPPIKDKSSGAQSIAGSWAAGQGNANEYHGVGLWFDMEEILFSGSTQSANQCPNVVSSGGNTRELFINDTYTELGGTWTDNEDGSGVAEISGDTVDTSQLGTYYVTYSYTDTNGCFGSTTLTVIVNDPNNDCPVVTSNAGNSLILDINVGDTYIEQGGTWTDTEDGSGNASIGGDTVNTEQEGTYLVEYSYTDSNNCTTSTVLTVNVTSLEDEILIESFDWNNERETRVVGDFFLPARTIIPSNPTMPYFWVLVSDESILSVNHNGVLTALKPGICVVTGITLDGTDLSDTIIIEVVAGDEDSLPIITVTDASATEGEPLNFIVALSEPSPEEIVLSLIYTNESTDKNDYNAPDQEIVFAVGETEKNVVVETLYDSIEEENEIFTLEIEVKQPVVSNKSAIQATGTIINADIVTEKKLIVSPNPASSGSEINITGIDQGTYQVSLYNMSGQLLNNRIVEFDGSLHKYILPSVGKGLYILNVENSESKNKEAGKIIIQ